jgi:23S rRNA pseudouridine1911/1915/1917 synthase
MEFKSKLFVFSGTTATPLDQVLKQEFSDASWNAVRKLIETGKVTVDGKLVRDTRQSVRPASSVELCMTRPKVMTAADPRILYVDQHVVVANKPTGIASVDHEAEPTSLQSELRTSLELQERKKLPPLKVVHRIDKVTSGVMVFARTQAAQADLKDQFRAHTTGRVYLAVAHGEVNSGTLSFRLVRDRGDGIRGVTHNPNLGYTSVTHVRVREHLPNCTLVECKLETGRTHQIRIHLAETGHPLVGEPLYIRDYPRPLIPCERTLLHAAQLSFVHPTFRNTRRYEVPLPAEFEAFLQRQRPISR